MYEQRVHDDELQTDTGWTAVGALHDGSLAWVVEQWALGKRDVSSHSRDRYSIQTHNAVQKWLETNDKTDKTILAVVCDLHAISTVQNAQALHS